MLTEPVPAWTTLALIKRPQGRKGEVLAELLTDFPDRFTERPDVFLARPGFTGAAAEARPAHISDFWLPVGRNEGRVVLAFAGVDSISDAEGLSGLEVLVPEHDRVPLEDEDTQYISDLNGCSVYELVNDTPRLIGRVADVAFPTTADGTRRLEEAAPLLVVEDVDGGELLIPYVKEFLVSLDVQARRIEMKLPQGLLDLNRNPQAKAKPQGDLGNQDGSGLEIGGDAPR